MKIEPDIDLGDRQMCQADLDLLYVQFVKDKRAYVLEQNGGAVFVARMPAETSRNIIKNDPGLRSFGLLKYLDGGEGYKNLGIDRAYAGWVHLIDEMKPLEHA